MQAPFEAKDVLLISQSDLLEHRVPTVADPASQRAFRLFWNDIVVLAKVLIDLLAKDLQVWCDNSAGIELILVNAESIHLCNDRCSSGGLDIFQISIGSYF